MEFRQLTPKDAPSCYALRLRGLENAPTAFQTTLSEGKERGVSFFERILSGNDNFLFGALVGGEVVGMTGILFETRPRTLHKATIWGVYVDIEHQRKGIATRLLDLSLECARSRPEVKVVYLSVESKNQNAKKLYESRGFVRWGTEPSALILGNKLYDEDHMSLLLCDKLDPL